MIVYVTLLGIRNTTNTSGHLLNTVLKLLEQNVESLILFGLQILLSNPISISHISSIIPFRLHSFTNLCVFNMSNLQFCWLMQMRQHHEESRASRCRWNPLDGSYETTRRTDGDEEEVTFMEWISSDIKNQMENGWQEEGGGFHNCRSERGNGGWRGQINGTSAEMLQINGQED